MGALPIQIDAKRGLPDYLPARMVNEFVYCPRLFFYAWVEGLFAESVDTKIFREKKTECLQADCSTFPWRSRR